MNAARLLRPVLCATMHWYDSLRVVSVTGLAHTFTPLDSHTTSPVTRLTSRKSRWTVYLPRHLLFHDFSLHTSTSSCG